MHQTCSPFVDELMYQTEYWRKNEVTVAVAKNMTGLCVSVVKCFAGIPCSESQRNKETYEQKCEKLEFRNYEVPDCLPSFYEAMIKRDNMCTAKFAFTSKNMTAKRAAFNTGKDCFLNVTKQVCSPMANAYLNSSYNKFVDILTTPPSNNRCNSISEEAMAFSCLPILKELGKKPSMWLCERANNCMKDVCAFPAHTIQSMKTSCNNLGIALFRQCFYTILGSTKNYSGYPCVQVLNLSQNVANQVPGSNAFASDKACMGAVMRAECSNLPPRKDFDKYWEDRFIQNV